MYEYEEVAPYIFVYENVIDNCEELIDLAFEENNWQKGVLRKENKQFLDTSLRDVEIHQILPIFKNDTRWFELSKTLWHYGNSYGIENNVAFSHMQDPQLLWYRPSEGFYKKHSDSGPDNPRVFSSVLYLNDVESGGETYFEKFNIGVKPKRGRLVTFPSNYAYVHEAKKTISDDKFAVVTWFTP